MNLEFLCSVDPSGQYLTTDPLFDAEYFATAKPDFTKVTSKHLKINPNETDGPQVGLVEKVKGIDLARTQLQDPNTFNQIFSEVCDLYAKKTIQPVFETFAINNVGRALKFMEGKKSLGKVLIKVT